MISNRLNCNSAVDHEQENGIRYISHILTNIPLKQEKEKEQQHRVTSTSTPAEDEEEEREKDKKKKKRGQLPDNTNTR